MTWDNKRKFQLDSLANLQLDIKGHQDILAELKSQEEITERKLREAGQGLAGIAEQKELLEEQIKILADNLFELTGDAKSIMVESLEGIKKSNEILDKHIEVIRKLGLKIEQETRNLDEIKDRQKIAHNQILEESRVLSIRKNDLDIYQRRVEEEYKKLLPDERVVV